MMADQPIWLTHGSARVTRVGFANSVGTVNEKMSEMSISADNLILSVINSSNRQCKYTPEYAQGVNSTDVVILCAHLETELAKY